MKRNEIIELGGKEYTLELNRESFIFIDKLCNIQKSMEIAKRDLYEYLDEEELTDDMDLDKLLSDANSESVEKELELKEKVLKNAIERSFLIWLKPNHNLKPSEVKALIEPYYEDEKKLQWISEKWGELLDKCIEIKEETDKERKNLEALANKKN